jgi:hypothetical protein
MINLKDIKRGDIGKKVEYKPDAGRAQRGIITSYNDIYIFVDYYNTGRGQATPPEKLTFITD